MSVRERFVAAAIAGTLLVVAGNLAPAQSNLIIGLLLPPEEPQAVSVREGVTLGVENANRTGGTNVQLVIRGRVGQWGADGVEAARMVLDDGAQGLIAPPDGAATHLVLQVSGRTAVPVVSLCADSSVTETGIPWMARIVPSTIEEAKVLFAFAPRKRWTAIVPAGRAGRQISADLTEAAKVCGCMLANTTNLDASWTNRGVVQKVLSANPQAILVWLDPLAAGLVAKQLRAAGFTGLLAGPGWLRSAEFIREKEAVEGFLVPSVVLQDEARIHFDEFSADFRKRFNREPDAIAAASYEAAELLIDILRKASARQPHEVFPLRNEVSGAFGNLEFDGLGNRIAHLQLQRIFNGRFVSESRFADNHFTETP